MAIHQKRKRILKNYKDLKNDTIAFLKKYDKKSNIIIQVGASTCEKAAGADLIAEEFKRHIFSSGVKHVKLKFVGCSGICSLEPVVTIFLPDEQPIIYQNVTPILAHEIFKKHILEENGNNNKNRVKKEKVPALDFKEKVAKRFFHLYQHEFTNQFEKFYPELIPYASSCRPPMGMMSALLKSYYAQKLSINSENIYVVAIMPCVAKKYEIKRPEHQTDGFFMTDAVLTTRELIWMIKSYGIEFEKLMPSEFDHPLGDPSGAGIVFGMTGGVMEAALRTAVEKLTGHNSDKIDFEEIRAIEGLRKRNLKIDGLTFNIGVADGLNNAKQLLDQVISGTKKFHLIEVMACPGGCIGGGRSTISTQKTIM